MSYFKKLKQENSLTEFTTKETLIEVSKYKQIGVPSRKLSQESANYAEIRSSISTTDGKTVTATYFPSYSQEGEVVGYIKRDWTIPKDERGHFTAVGSVKEKNKLFNQQNIQKGGKRLYIVEGHEEVTALREILLNSVKGTKWEGKIIPNVIGLPLGTGNAAACVAHNLEFIQSFDEIVLAFDSDSATPQELKKGILKGKEAKEDVANVLLSDNLFTFTHPHGCKDSRECLVKGYGEDLAKIVSFNLEKYSPEKIIAGTDVDIDTLIAPLKEGHYIERYPELMKKLHGIREGNELITYCAFSGVGKSTLAREIGWELSRVTAPRSYNVGFIFLEEPVTKTQQSLVALELGVLLPAFRQNALSVATREQINAAAQATVQNGRVFFLNHFGSMKVEKLMQQIKYLHFINGCTHIFIDHISMVVAGLESNNERKDIDMLYEELAAFMTTNNVTIHAVCHLKRVEEHVPKVKDGETPKAYWREVKKEMLRGSSGIEQMSSCIIALENEVLPDNTRGRVRTKILKDREWGVLGLCDTMLQQKDGRLHVVPTYEGWRQGDKTQEF